MADSTMALVSPDLLAEAERLGIPVGPILDAELRRQIEKHHRIVAWQEANRVAIEAANGELEREGLWYERFPRR